MLSSSQVAESYVGAYVSFKFEANSVRIGDTMMFEKRVKQEKTDSEKIDGKV